MSSRAQGHASAKVFDNPLGYWALHTLPTFCWPLNAAMTEARGLWAVLRSSGWHPVAQQSSPTHQRSCRVLALRPVAALQAMQGEIKRLTEEVKALLKKHDAQAGLIMTIEQRVSCPPAVWAWPHVCVVAPGQCMPGRPDCWRYLGSALSLHWRPQPASRQSPDE